MDAELKHPRLQRLRCSVQNYNWGKRGAESQVAKLYASNSGSTIEENKPYAELWMGTHESGPSFVVESGVDNAVAMRSHTLSLKEWIAKNPNVLGQKVLDKWGCDLPFLFKVLSVAKALSIQAHPDKELAKQLHKRWPDIYKDDNHKPEMALAITDFEALCGFIPLKELKLVLGDVPEIVELVGTADANQILNTKEQDEEVKSLLRSVFTQLMSANKEMVTMVTSKLKSRLHMESQARQLTDKEELVLRLEKQYPADVGVISAFFFNHVKLHPGEALYLGPNEPHAYILGECIECMATSDNVVRAGLTPKHRDIQTLCSMLTYKQGFPDILKGCAVKLSSYVTRYSPPFEEFEVDRCVLPGGASTVFTAVPGPSVFIITLGQGTMHAESSKDVITEGDAVFAPAGTKIYITSLSELHLYRAGLNDQFLQKQ